MATTKLVFENRGCGIYRNYKHGMCIEHEATWSASAGRQWIAEWTESFMGMSPDRHSRKFRTMAEARRFLEGLLARDGDDDDPLDIEGMGDPYHGGRDDY